MKVNSSPKRAGARKNQDAAKNNAQPAVAAAATSAQPAPSACCSAQNTCATPAVPKTPPATV